MKHNIVDNNSNAKFNWEEIARHLWTLLDDIDTASDMFKPPQNGFYKYVMKKSQERSLYGYSPDGYKLIFNVKEWKERE